jgi:hypothetical protein
VSRFPFEPGRRVRQQARYGGAYPPTVASMVASLPLVSNCGAAGLSPALQIATLFTRYLVRDTGALLGACVVGCLALHDINVRTFSMAGINLSRPADALARILYHFIPLCYPPSCSCQCKQGREHRRRKANRF